MKVRWTARAEARLDAIHAYIAQDNPDAALRIVHEVLRRSAQIEAFPGSGRRVADFARDDVRELIEGQYRIVYRIGTTYIDVLTVMHLAQLLPTDLKRL
jgi:plasmid stabilization system protein ParE